MASLRQRLGRWTVSIRHRGQRAIYETFDKKSDALRFINKVESEIQQKRYKDISEASKTSLRLVLHRYIREKIKNKPDKARERSKFNVILRHDICKKMLTELRTSDFAKYRDERSAIGITNSTINRELSSTRVAIQTSIAGLGDIEQDLANEYWQEQYQNYLNQGGTLNYQQFMQQQMNLKVSREIDKRVKDKMRTEGIAQILSLPLDKI